MGIITDTETTGLLRANLAANALQPQLIEIYLGKFDEKTFKITDELNFFIKPITAWGEQILLEDPVNELKHICRITGIYDSDLYSAQTFDEVAEQIHHFIKDEELIVGHNIMFDLEVIRHNFIRIGQAEYHNDFRLKVCTVEMSHHILKKRMKLGQLYKLATGEVMPVAHRAKADALATLTCYKWLQQQGF